MPQIQTNVADSRSQLGKNLLSYKQQNTKSVQNLGSLNQSNLPVYHSVEQQDIHKPLIESQPFITNEKYQQKQRHIHFEQAQPDLTEFDTVEAGSLGLAQKKLLSEIL